MHQDYNFADGHRFAAILPQPFHSVGGEYRRGGAGKRLLGRRGELALHLGVLLHLAPPAVVPVDLLEGEAGVGPEGVLVGVEALPEGAGVGLAGQRERVFADLVPGHEHGAVVRPA